MDCSIAIAGTGDEGGGVDDQSTEFFCGAAKAGEDIISGPDVGRGVFWEISMIVRGRGL